ncbi:MAG: hypothetical protein ACYC96_10270 [Fimbriimonadaceae bacterium]
MVDQSGASPNLGQKLQALPKPILYLALIIATTAPLFFDIKIPNKPTDAAVDMYAELMTIPADKPVLISTEWTNGTRAESRGEFEALMRILMHRNIKFVIFSIADPQAPPVAKDAIRDLNAERVAAHERPYERWNDWVDVGFYANGEGTAEALAVSIKKAFSGKQDLNPQGESEDVFDSPVLKGVTTLQDIAAFINVTASATDIVYLQRLASKTTFLEFCTGVMGPEAIPYYASGQTKGLASGLKGVIDLETLMVTGIPAGVSTKVSQAVPGMLAADDPRAKGRGYRYYPALHVAILLMILMIIIGNVGMFMAKRSAAA